MFRKDFFIVVIAIFIFLAIGFGRFTELIFDPHSVTAEKLTAADAFNLGQYYFNHGDSADGTYDLVKARYYFEQAAAKDPAGNLLTWHQLGRIDFLEGQFDSALYHFNKQLEYFGDELPNVYYMLGLTHAYMARDSGRSESWRLAEDSFINYLKHDPKSPWAKVDLGWIYFAEGRYEEMLPLLETGLFDHPDNPWLLNMYGLALLNTGSPGEALGYFQRAKIEADKLTIEDWGKSYPGNDPRVWARGLGEFRTIIQKNIDLVI